MIGGTRLRRPRRSTARPRRAASRARPSSCSSISPRSSEGWEPDDTISNMPIEQGSYRPKNAGGNYSETITLADAFAQSSNVAAVRLFGEVGDEDGDRDGARARRALADRGRRSERRARHLDDDADGADRRLCRGRGQRLPGRADRVRRRGAGLAREPGSTARTASAAASTRTSSGCCARRSTAAPAARRCCRARTSARPAPRQDNRDALFVGYAGGLVVGVWVGNDDNTPLAGRLRRRAAGADLEGLHAARRSASAPRPARPRPSPDPSGPVEPQDVPELERHPARRDANLRIGEGGAVLSTDIGACRST